MTLRELIQDHLRRHGWTEDTKRGPMPVWSKPGVEDCLYFAEAVILQCEAEDAEEPVGAVLADSQLWSDE